MSGKISCRVTGTKQYSAGLIQGGLEIPCHLILSASTKELIEMALTLLFAACMLDDGTSRDNGPSGDGSTFLGLKYFSMDIFKLSRKIT